MLIDTHILVWWLSSPSKIRAPHRKLIAKPDNVVCISMISVFELYIKASLGKVELPEDFLAMLEQTDFTFLPLQFPHFEAYRQLPVVHKDPFDRLIIAQAVSENLPVMSYDQVFTKYPIDLL